MSQMKQSYEDVLQNFFVASGLLDHTKIDSFRNGLLWAARDFLEKPLAETLGDHVVIKKLEHLSQRSTLTLSEAADVIRCIEAVQTAVHESAHYAAAFVATKADDVVLKGIFMGGSKSEARARCSFKVNTYWSTGGRMYVLKAPSFFDMGVEVIYNLERHVIGWRAYDYDNETVDEIIFTSGIVVDETLEIYNKGEIILAEVNDLLTNHCAELEPAVVEGARLVLDMCVEEQLGIPGSQIDLTMSHFLTRGQWADVIP